MSASTNKQWKRYAMERNDMIHTVEYQSEPGGEWRTGVKYLSKASAESLAEQWKRLRFCHDTRVV